MVRMGTVWDRTTEVLSGRGGAMARIAFLGIFLPTAARSAYAAYAEGPTVAPAIALVGGLLSIAVLCLLIWAQLALIALSSDPATTPSHATALAARRLGPALAIVIVLGLLFAVLIIPPFVVLFASGATFSPDLIGAGIMPTIPPAAGLFFALYLLAFAIFVVFISARLAVVNAVVVNERLGLGAIRRSFALTRGSTWRIIGVLVLYAVVILVATIAAQSVVGLVFRVILGANAVATVTFLASLAGAAVTAALTTVAAAFVAQLYVATVGAAPTVG